MQAQIWAHVVSWLKTTSLQWDATVGSDRARVITAFVPTENMPDAFRLPVAVSKRYTSPPIGTSTPAVLCGL